MRQDLERNGRSPMKILVGNTADGTSRIQLQGFFATPI